MPHSTGPIIVDLPRTRASLDFNRLIPALRDAFIAGATVPLRHAHRLESESAATASLLLMPAWQGGTALGVKIVTVFPDNGKRGLNAVSSTYLLCDGQTGQHLAVIDGNEITGRRTAAASALAGDYLARRDASSLLIVGAGHIAGMLAAAWAAVRPIREVRVWNHRTARAAALAATLGEAGFDATVADDLETAVRASDIISCATLATTPLIHGGWLRPGAHLDLVGGFRPDMREADDDAVRVARVFIDTDAALTEAGDIVHPLASSALTREAIAGTLFTLCRGETPGRQNDQEITLFKSVGSAIEDLAAAALVWSDMRGT
ncbi:Delta(1)-pyrroline-2-carboxylate reductase [Rhodovastum atsumiense]|uniref:Ornithine cyclodeaminase family protein n=1 Tax=Rhodovastum atsumiense TaxID=504468 RepID=A0A5M6IS03_9PROT|nr:ornithine cyclodeaminase family protein [Rhodovastum atsumiense]KAA5611076.1 ornithine cyclodeaminase family protein [Rhodovastum atsumiense]CAH2599135.1 Delta(1)-pyrroline-2-carboxylate reductase [Rhodovastum atsumiense]